MSAAVNAMPRLCGRWSGLEAEPEATGAPRCQVTLHMTREQTLIAVERLEAEAEMKKQKRRGHGATNGPSSGRN